MLRISRRQRQKALTWMHQRLHKVLRSGIGFKDGFKEQRVVKYLPHNCLDLSVYDFQKSCFYVVQYGL